MKKSAILLFIIFIISTFLIGCAKPVPKECYRSNIQAMYLCDGGERITTFKGKTEFELVKIDGTKIMCNNPSNAPCNIYSDNDYCPKINFCEKPQRERS